MGLISTIELDGHPIAHREAVSHSPDGTEKIMVLSTWMVVLGAVRLVCAIANYALAALETWRLEPTSIRRWNWFFEENQPIFLLSSAWPLILGLALRRTRWPELLKAGALTFLILSMGGVFSMMADWGDIHAKWINVGSFHIARSRRLPSLGTLIGHPDRPAWHGSTAAGVRDGRSCPLHGIPDPGPRPGRFRPPHPGAASAIRPGGNLSLGGLPDLDGSAAGLVGLARDPESIAPLDPGVHSPGRFPPNSFDSAISSIQPHDAIRIHEVEVLLNAAFQAWVSERYFQSWDNYQRVVSMADTIPQSAKASVGRRSIAQAFNGWAWLLATCPELNLRNPQDAVAYAKRAIDLEPNDRDIWNTLGVAYYRLGSLEEARSALYRSMELYDEGDAFDWFFLAMIHAKFDHKERARVWYDKAVEWSHLTLPGNAELYRFQVEAAQVLGLPKPERIPTPPPSKVARPPPIRCTHGGFTTARTRPDAQSDCAGELRAANTSSNLVVSPWRHSLSGRGVSAVTRQTRDRIRRAAPSHRCVEAARPPASGSSD